MACETARLDKLEPLRKQYTDECIAKKQKDPEGCVRFYKNYGGQSAGAHGQGLPGKFYGLPECKNAFEFKRSHRRSSD